MLSRLSGPIWSLVTGGGAGGYWLYWNTLSAGLISYSKRTLTQTKLILAASGKVLKSFQAFWRKSQRRSSHSLWYISMINNKHSQALDIGKMLLSPLFIITHLLSQAVRCDHWGVRVIRVLKCISLLGFVWSQVRLWKNVEFGLIKPGPKSSSHYQQTV